MRFSIQSVTAEIKCLEARAASSVVEDLPSVHEALDPMGAMVFCLLSSESC